MGSGLVFNFSKGIITQPLYFRLAMETSTPKQGWGSLLELCALWQVIMRIKSDKKDLIISLKG